MRPSFTRTSKTLGPAIAALMVLALPPALVGAAPDDIIPDDGYDSPREAAQTFFDAVEQDDYEKMRTTLVPEVREGFDQLGEAWVKSIEIEEVEIIRVEQVEEPDPDQQRAHVYYEWDVTVEMSEVADQFEEIMIESLREQGLSEEEIETFIDLQMEVIRRQLERQAEQMQRREQRMILVEIEDRWFVDVPADEEYQPEIDDEELEEEDAEDDEAFVPDDEMEEE